MSLAKFIIGETGGQIDLSITNVAPSNPTSDYITLYTDGSALYAIDSTGTDILAGGISGTSGTSGTSGVNGSSGTSGTSGVSGSSGTSGTSGVNGSSGTSGTSGVNGSSGTSGTSGVNGSSGTSGTSGVSGSSGTSGTSGVNGSSGTSGTSGAQGPTGPQGEPGFSNSFFNYLAKTNSQSGDPGSGFILWNNATQASATSLNISDTDDNGNNVDIFFANLIAGSKITIQDQNNHVNYQTWTIGTPTDNTTYWTLPVTLVTSTHSFSNNDPILFIFTAAPSGSSGTSGTSGTSGLNGSSGSSGTSGTSGINGATGAAGTSGSSGSSGVSGSSGSSGTSGLQGPTGATGPAGVGTPSPITLEQTNSLVSTAIGATATVGNSIVIGNTACSTAVSAIVLGNTAKAEAACAIAIGLNSCVTAGFSSIAIGELSLASAGNRVVAIGQSTCGTNVATVVGAFACGTDVATAVGYDARGTGCRTAVLGAEATASALRSIAIGNCAVASHTCAVALGANITTERADTTHVNSLIAYGQGVSKFNDIGSTGGTVTVNWDNSNDQGITLTSSISSLTFSNPISGANYLLKLTQGGAGSYTVTWPGTVVWLNGAPTLQTAVAAVDIVSFFYDGTTFYGARAPQDGATGPAGAAGATGPQGATGPAGSGSPSPIVVEGTNTLVATGVGATGAGTNNISIGTNAKACLGGNSIAIGTDACAMNLFCDADRGGIAIGRCARSEGRETIAIGEGAVGCQGAYGISIGRNSYANDGVIAIGNTARGNSGYSIAIGEATLSSGPQIVVIGAFACGINSSGSANSVVIGRSACLDGLTSQLVGSYSCSFRDNSSVFGSCSMNCSENGISVGFNNRIFTGATGSIVLGNCSTGATGFGNAIVIGNNLTTERSNTVHVDSLIAYGQAASKAHAIGSTGGTVTLDWDNSNIQTLTLTSSITTLNKIDQIDGGVYTVFVTQGGTGSYTVNWGTDVRWAGGTGPTLSTAVGATDAVTLVYVAGITGYYGNINKNFA